LKAGVIVVRLVSSRYTSYGEQIKTTYSAEEVDAIAVYCERLDECFLLPIGLVAKRRGIQLRVSPPKNGQRACLNWCDTYRLDGAIAQLGERLTGSQEVGGSSPPGSTIENCVVQVGAHEFR
jgi:hypothetical protein